MSSWPNLLAARLVAIHRTTDAEQANLRAVVDRNLGDLRVAGLSEDRRFGIAYEAALALTRMAIAKAGYRVLSGGSHHQVAFQCLGLAVPGGSALGAYFDRCRRKRNMLEYDAAQFTEGNQPVPPSRSRPSVSPLDAPSRDAAGAASIVVTATELASVQRCGSGAFIARSSSHHSRECSPFS